MEDMHRKLGYIHKLSNCVYTCMCMRMHLVRRCEWNVLWWCVDSGKLVCICGTCVCLCIRVRCVDHSLIKHMRFSVLTLTHTHTHTLTRWVKLVRTHTFTWFVYLNETTCLCVNSGILACMCGVYLYILYMHVRRFACIRCVFLALWAPQNL